MIEPLPVKFTPSKAPVVEMVGLHLVRWHQMVADLPRWDDHSLELRALADDIAERGIDTPLIVTRSENGRDDEEFYFLIDGRHRSLAAEMAGLEEIPVKVVPEEEAAGIVLNSLFQRRHYTKSAQALLLYDMFPGLRARMGKRGNPTGPNQHGGGMSTGVEIPRKIETAQEFAERLGIPQDYFTRIHAALDACLTPEERDLVREWLLNGEKSASTILPALMGRRATAGLDGSDEPPPKKNPVDVYKGFRRSFIFITNQAAQWNELEQERRKELRAMWFELRKVLPKELVELL